MAGETQASHQSVKKRIQSVFEVTVRDIRKRGGGQRKSKTEGNKSGAGLVLEEQKEGLGTKTWVRTTVKQKSHSIMGSPAH